MVNVIIINGKSGSGKDTFSNFVKEYTEIDECLIHKDISSVQFIKDALLSIGWDGVRNDDARDLISHIKEWSIRNGDLPTKNIVTYVLDLVQDKENDYIVFVHIREIQEIQKLYDILHNALSYIGISCHTVYVDRDVNVSAKNNSDTGENVSINGFKYDFIVDNNDEINILKKQAEKLISYIL